MIEIRVARIFIRGVTWPDKASVHAVPDGENMVMSLDGTSRHVTVREAAQLQGLSDTFELPGSWSQAMRQLGNAVPVQLAAVAGLWIASALG
ncbi:DNA cytosine methyltransferase [Paraburkholderia sp. D1E]|uniref:DNA cytosine methyltransferase n=1 Tax=Paraburkholderia sp. D1E TaxID=3461398 RepID=UPI004046504D